MDYTFIRKRFIPEEEVDISGDEVLYDDGALIVTRWLPIRARNDIGWGFYGYWDIIRSARFSTGPGNSNSGTVMSLKRNTRKIKINMCLRTS